MLVVLAAGGGAYALAGGHRHTGAQPPAQSSVTGPGTTAPTEAPTSPAVNASASPTVSPSASVTPSPADPGAVQAAAGAASDPAAPRVLAYLNRYFSAINRHDYDAYQSLLDAGQQAADPRSAFDSGYATTKDSDEVVNDIEAAGGGQLTANVTFTSHQSPADSVDGSACNNWQVSFYLVPRGSGYVRTAAPPGYHAGYTDC